MVRVRSQKVQGHGSPPGSLDGPRPALEPGGSAAASAATWTD
jgi:hypothetical protein